MTESVKPAHKRGGKREGPATARNASALLVNPLDSQHIVGVEEITLPGGVPVISARISFDGGTCWKESWPLPAETEWAGVVGPVLAMDAHGTLNLAALALDPDRSRASLVVYRSEDGGIHWTLPAAVLQGAAECCYSIATDLNPGSTFRGSGNALASADVLFGDVCAGRRPGAAGGRAAAAGRSGARGMLRTGLPVRAMALPLPGRHRHKHHHRVRGPLHVGRVPHAHGPVRKGRPDLCPRRRPHPDGTDGDGHQNAALPKYRRHAPGPGVRRLVGKHDGVQPSGAVRETAKAAGRQIQGSGRSGHQQDHLQYPADEGARRFLPADGSFRSHLRHAAVRK